MPSTKERLFGSTGMTVQVLPFGDLTGNRREEGQSSKKSQHPKSRAPNWRARWLFGSRCVGFCAWDVWGGSCCVHP